MRVWANVAAGYHFSNFGSLKSTETLIRRCGLWLTGWDFSNFGSLKSTETLAVAYVMLRAVWISAISAR